MRPTAIRTQGKVLVAGIVLSCSAIAWGQYTRPPVSVVPGKTTTGTDYKNSKEYKEQLRRLRKIEQERQRRLERARKSRDLIGDAKKALEQARIEQADKMLAEAYDLTDDVETADRTKLREWIEEQRGELKKQGEAMFDLAGQKSQEKDYDEAMKSYRRLALIFEGADLGKQAMERLNEIRDDPAIQAELGARKVHEQVMQTLESYWKVKLRPKPKLDSEGKLVTAEMPAPMEIFAKLDLDRQVALVKQLRWVVERHAESETGAKLAALLKEIESKEEIIKPVDEAIEKSKITKADLKQEVVADEDRDAKKLHDRAQALERVGMKRRAKQIYMEIVEKHAKSSYFKRAYEAYQRLRVY